MRAALLEIYQTADGITPWCRDVARLALEDDKQ